MRKNIINRGYPCFAIPWVARLFFRGARRQVPSRTKVSSLRCEIIIEYVVLFPRSFESSTWCPPHMLRAGTGSSYIPCCRGKRFPSRAKSHKGAFRLQHDRLLPPLPHVLSHRRAFFLTVCSTQHHLRNSYCGPGLKSPYYSYVRHGVSCTSNFSSKKKFFTHIFRAKASSQPIFTLCRYPRTILSKYLPGIQ